MLMAVGEEISRVGTFIDVIHVVVGCGVEGHTDVLRFQKFLVLAIIACDIDVPTAEAFLCLCGKIETHPVGEEEGIVLLHALLIRNVEWFWCRPMVTRANCAAQGKHSFVGCGEESIVAKCIYESKFTRSVDRQF